MKKIKKTAVLFLSLALIIQGCSSIERERAVTEKKDSNAGSPKVRQEMVKKTKVVPAAPIVAQTGNHLNGQTPTLERRKPSENQDKFADQDFNTEEYSRIYENPFLEVLKNPLSTFSIDVDTASYANVRRFITSNSLPPKDAVRIEEMINYFTYDYPQPEGTEPFSINAEISESLWNKENKLVHIGLKGKEIDMKKAPPGNLIFLLDVSGSMNSPDKLPLLKSAFKLLVNELSENDKVSIVVYAGAAGAVLPSTTGDKKGEILKALDSLEAGGSTAGGQGIELAYKMAKDNFIKNGNNRVILATDGDFNVGTSSTSELVRMIERKRKDGIFLSILGFGTGNYKDSRMEELADKGNGNYAYLDTINEAKKVLVNEMGGTLYTIAKDVKLQVEFNPARVHSYRLIGYENRVMRNEDFDNDKKDAGDLGSGHTVTALYEIVPSGSKISNQETLKYQEVKIKENSYTSEEIMSVKFRYKEPDKDESKLIVKTIKEEKSSIEKASDNFRFSAAVAGFGMLLRDSEYKGKLTAGEILSLAKSSKGKDKEGYRKEFIQLVENYNQIND